MICRVCWALIVAASLSWSGCSNDGDTSGTGGTSGAGGAGATGGAPAECDPVAQSDCLQAEKCAFVVLDVDPFSGETRCVSEGSEQKGDPCTSGEPGDDGFDNCQGGLQCVAGQCEEICNESPDSCGESESCQAFAGLFADRPGVGVCQFSCDPLMQNCPSEQGCYLSLSTGETLCADPATMNTQGGACGPMMGDEFLNGCEIGYGCMLPNDPINFTALVCAFFCDPDGGSPSCADGPGAGFDCRRINEFYSDADNVDPALGLCVDPGEFPEQ